MHSYEYFLRNDSHFSSQVNHEHQYLHHKFTVLTLAQSSILATYLFSHILFMILTSVISRSALLPKSWNGYKSNTRLEVQLLEVFSKSGTFQSLLLNCWWMRCLYVLYSSPRWMKWGKSHIRIKSSSWKFYLRHAKTQQHKMADVVSEHAPHGRPRMLLLNITDPHYIIPAAPSTGHYCLHKHRELVFSKGEKKWARWLYEEYLPIKNLYF